MAPAPVLAQPKEDAAPVPSTSALSLCPRGQPVVVARTQLSVPGGLNPEVLECVLPGSGTRVSW